VSAHHCTVLCIVGNDYTFSGSTDSNVDVIIPAGEVSHDVSFTVIDDNILESAELFGMNIMITSTSKDVLLGGNSAAMVTLQDRQGFSKC